MSNIEKRGGKRPGAGRPAGEKTVQIRVPVGAVDLVRSLVENYRNGLKGTPEINYTQVDWVDPDSVPAAPKIKRPPKNPTKKAVVDASDQLRILQGLSRKHRRFLLSKHGSLENAALCMAAYEAGKAGQNMDSQTK